MIKRELYMSRIRRFIGTELIKVMTGIHRCGKSVMILFRLHLLTEESRLQRGAQACLFTNQPRCDP